MIEDMTMEDGETYRLIEAFRENLKKAEEAYKKGKYQSYYYVLRSTIW